MVGGDCDRLVYAVAQVGRGMYRISSATPTNMRPNHEKLLARFATIDAFVSCSDAAYVTHSGHRGLDSSQ